MNRKDFKKGLRHENAQINIEMSEQLKNTKIVTSVETNKPIQKSKSSLFPKFAIALSCVILLFVCVGVFLLNNTNESIGLTSYIMEINPAICITTNKDDKIINICALNEDANEIVFNEELENIIGLAFEDCVDKVMKVIKDKGYLEGYQNTIKLYAINDNTQVLNKRLDNFEKVMKKKLDDFGVGYILFEKYEIGMEDFKEKMGFDESFDKLDDMNDFFKDKDSYHTPVPEHNSNEQALDNDAPLKELELQDDLLQENNNVPQNGEPNKE